MFFGNDSLISYDTCIRTGDPHLLYDINTHKRINLSKSVYVGDHVWIGQHVMFLKNVMIGSGSVVGAMALLSGKKYSSNTVYGGNPAKAIKKDIFFLKPDCHRFMDEDILKHSEYNGDEYIYEGNNGINYFNEIENNLKKMSIEDKIKYLDKISNENNKNRFSVE